LIVAVFGLFRRQGSLAAEDHYQAWLCFSSLALKNRFTTL
jgi:hypothetical protein